jgi:hypothetical protein
MPRDLLLPFHNLRSVEVDCRATAPLIHRSTDLAAICGTTRRSAVRAEMVRLGAMPTTVHALRATADGALL